MCGVRLLEATAGRGAQQGRQQAQLEARPCRTGRDEEGLQASDRAAAPACCCLACHMMCLLRDGCKACSSTGRRGQLLATHEVHHTAAALTTRGAMLRSPTYPPACAACSALGSKGEHGLGCGVDVQPCEPERKGEDRRKRRGAQPLRLNMAEKRC